jgi:hypothetical protein
LIQFGKRDKVAEQHFEAWKKDQRKKPGSPLAKVRKWFRRWGR